MAEFKDLGLSQVTLKALEKKGYTTPTEIQEKTIPLLLDGRKDVIGESQTGSGKTASFALPIIEKVNPNSKDIQAIILVPTRELAVQVAKEFESLRGEKKVYSLAVYGGTSIREQLKQIRRGVQVIVGTPGRTLDLIRRNSLKLRHVKFAVLDEADEMLNMGFIEDIESILSKTGKDKRMLLFSATMPRQIVGISKKFMHQPVHVKLERSRSSLKIEEYYYNIMARDRFEGIRRIVDLNADFYGIIFCNTKSDVDNISHQLQNAGYRAAALHGDISQPQREKILLQLRKKQISILVATDVAARGIDVNDLTHIVNFSLPQSPESYTHRIGRTARAGKKGIAITFLIPSEARKLKFIERIINRRIEKREIPSSADIMEARENHMKSKVHNLIETGKSKNYDAFTEDLLANHDPKKIISALLKEAFSNVLDERNHRDISKVSSRANKKGGRERRDRKSRNRPRNQEGSGRSYGRKSRQEGSGRSEGRSFGRKSREEGSDDRSEGRSFGKKSRKSKREGFFSRKKRFGFSSKKKRR